MIDERSKRRRRPGNRIRIVAAGWLMAFMGAAAAGDGWTVLLQQGIGGDVDVTPGSAWQLDDGVLSPAEGVAMTYVISKKAYKDFELELEVYPTGNTNSGVFVRCPDKETQNPTACYEFNIWDAHAVADFRTGSIVTVSPPLADVSTENRWNRMRIRLQGEHLQVWINDVKTNDIFNSAHDSGYIAFQYGGAGGMVKFRNIRIREL